MWYSNRNRLTEEFNSTRLIEITRARFLKYAAILIGAAALVHIPVYLWILPAPAQAWVPPFLVVAVLICGIVVILAERGYAILGGIILNTMLVLAMTVTTRGDTLLNRPIGSTLALPIVIAGFINGVRAALIMCSIVLASFILVPFFSDAVWTPHTFTNVAQLLLSVGMLGIAQHLMKQIRTKNQQLQETNEREQRARAFIGFFQHELKSYTTALEGLIELFKPSITATIDERSALVLNELDRGIARLNNLARQLMVLSREGIVPYRMQDIALAPLFRQAKADIEAAGARDHLPLIVEMHVAADVRVCGDSQYLALAIGTALRNALEASAHQLRQQEAMRISLSALRQGQRVVIRVEDTGPGFSAPILEALEQATSQRALPLFGWSTKASGAGLGLPLIMHIAQLHGGTAQFSNTARGACVAFDVAYAAVAGETAPVTATTH